MQRIEIKLLEKRVRLGGNNYTITRATRYSRIRNSGDLDLETLDETMVWDGFPPFPLRGYISEDA